MRQTARCLRTAIEPNLIHTYIEPRVREQEFGNLQGDEFRSSRTEQMRVGRFFYRFPTGESGADVYGRLCSWWEGWVRGVNLRPGCERADALVVVSHGLTMRLVLMQLYGWSPNTFSTIWNAGNCDMYVLKRDLSRPGHSPYEICRREGDYPHSTLDVEVTMADGRCAPPRRPPTPTHPPTHGAPAPGAPAPVLCALPASARATAEPAPPPPPPPRSERTLPLNDYLSIAPPRTTRPAEAARMLAKQHGIDLHSIVDVDFFASRAGYNKDVVSPRRNKRASVNFSSSPGTPVSPGQSACGRIGASISLGSILLQRRDEGGKEAPPRSAPVSMRASRSYDSGGSRLGAGVCGGE